jgi:carbamoyltransferase
MGVILGINNSHNGSVAIICEGKIIAAIQAERISRRKREPLKIGENNELMQACVNYCLKVAEKKHSDIDAIAISTPWNVQKLPDHILFKSIGGVPDNYVGTFYVPHHLAHMEYIVHFGELEPGIVLVIDGSGSLEQDRAVFNFNERMHPELLNHADFCGKEVVSAYWFDGENSSLVYRFSPSRSPSEEYNKSAPFDEQGIHLQSIGHYWEWASQYCCGTVNGAGKVMGLTAFGEFSDATEPRILSFGKDKKIIVSYELAQSLYNKPNLFGLDISGNSHYETLAARVQYETEMTILEILQFLKNRYPTDTLYYSGGVALNVVANEKIIRSGLFENVILNGSVEDNGTAIGSALAVSYKLERYREHSPVTDYFGCDYNQDVILEALETYNFSYELMTEKQLIETVAHLISQDKVIGWFQGRSEFGPRALGNRSILANPKSRGTKYLLDHLMKCRDRYRPYAPVIIEEYAQEYFNINGTSPVMMRNVEVLDESLVAIKHVDGNARIQTVNKKHNLKLYKLLLEVKKMIGCPILLNTSFNLPGEPIVESPSDALSSFSRGAIDYLCLNNIMVSRG